MTVLFIEGDNRRILRELYESGGDRFALVYMDPPFYSQRDYETSDGKAAFGDRWASLDEYLAALRETVCLARDLLIPQGSLVLHLDQSASHYAKVMCDTVFGRECFASEIIWRYRRWPAACRNFQGMHDTLLRYVRDPQAKPRFNQLYEPRSSSTLETWGTGKMSSRRGKSGSKTTATADESPGAPLSDVWEIPLVAPSGNERTEWPTQKPEALIARLVDALSNEGDNVLDPFCGSGTVPAVCAKRGRSCVSIDKSETALRIARERLAPILAQPSLFGEVSA